MKPPFPILLAFLCSALISGSGWAHEEEEGTPKADTSATPEAEAGKVYDPTDMAALEKAVGAPVVVEGTIVKSGESKSGKVMYLNFAQDFWKGLALVFFTEKTSVPAETLQGYVGKKVRVTGPLTEHQKHLQIVIDDLSQIEVLAEAEASPPAKEP